MTAMAQALYRQARTQSRWLWRGALFHGTLILLWLALTSGMHAHAAEAWQSPDYLQQAFIEVALRSEYVPGKQSVRKWQQPVRVWLQHDAAEAEQHTRLTSSHLRHLAQLTGLDIHQVSSPAAANLTVVFTDLVHMPDAVKQLSGQDKPRIPADAACLFGIQTDARKAIQRAWVVIPVDHAQEHGMLVGCIVEELTQAMGLPNDSDKVFPSIFNDKTPEVLLTGLDGLLLKMLYATDIQPGMREPQVRPVLARLIQQWQQDGTLAQAEQQVRQSELYQWLGF